MQVLVIINNITTKINVGVNVKNWLTKEYVIKDLFVILVIVNVNMINYFTYLDCKNCKCRKKKLIKLVMECSENTDGNEMIHS